MQQHLPIDPADLIAFHREHFGDAVMTHPAPPAPPAPTPPAPAPTPPAPAPTPPAPPAADGLEGLTPEELAALGDPGRAAIRREREADAARQAAETARQQAQAELDRIRLAQLPPDQQAIEAARQEAAASARREAEQAHATQLATERAGRILAEARATAIEAGVKPERVNAFVRVLDLTNVTATDGQIDPTRLRSAVDAELEATPEFRRGDAPPPIRRAAPGSGQGAQPPAPVDVNAQVAATVATMQAALGQPVAKPAQ